MGFISICFLDLWVKYKLFRIVKPNIYSFISYSTLLNYACLIMLICHLITMEFA